MTPPLNTKLNDEMEIGNYSYCTFTHGPQRWNHVSSDRLFLFSSSPPSSSSSSTSSTCQATPGGGVGVGWEGWGELYCRPWVLHCVCALVHIQQTKNIASMLPSPGEQSKETILVQF